MGEYLFGQPLRDPQVSKGHEGDDQGGLKEGEGEEEKDSQTCSVYVYWWSVYLFTGGQFIFENKCTVYDLMIAEAVSRRRRSTSSSSRSS